jgi:hypothetical protein
MKDCLPNTAAEIGVVCYIESGAETRFYTNADETDRIPQNSNVQPTIQEQLA